MNPFAVGMLRHGLTGLGMYLFGQGTVDEAQIQEAVGAVIAAGSAGWFAAEKLLGLWRTYQARKAA